MYEKMVFDDPTPAKVEVTIGGEEYVLKEASGDTAVKYRNMLLRATKMSDGKVSGIDGMADAEPYLVSACLFRIVDMKGTRTEVPVALAAVRAFKDSILKQLFERVKKISGLDDKETEQSLKKKIADLTAKLEALKGSGDDDAKNSLSATTDG